MEAASELSVIPNVDSMINVNVECKDSTGSSLCSPGSTCIQGDVGVYCECYVPEFSGEEVN